MTPESPDSRYLATLTVLLVEDDPDAREELARFLRRRVGSLIIAEDGEEGLAAYRARHPRMVVTDIQMPNLDGLAMVQAIRDEDPAVPVIVTTAFECSTYLVRSIELGIDRYVLKPIQPGILDAALLKCAHRLLAEEQLRLRERLEAEAAKARRQAARSTLLGGLAHDYSNLVQVIANAVDMAGELVDPASEAGLFLAMARKSADEARHLSRRLAILGRSPGNLNQVGPLDPLVRETVQAALAGTGIELVFELHAAGAALRHHRETFTQVVRCLAENALEAMPGGGTLRVSTEVRPGAASGRRLGIRFQDTGRGIPAGILPLIFNPYFSTKERGAQRGMGLGLALCEAIVRAHGGAISAESGPGRGAAFLIELPLAEEG